MRVVDVGHGRWSEAVACTTAGSAIVGAGGGCGGVGGGAAIAAFFETLQVPEEEAGFLVADDEDRVLVRLVEEAEAHVEEGGVRRAKGEEALEGAAKGGAGFLELAGGWGGRSGWRCVER